MQSSIAPEMPFARVSSMYMMPSIQQLPHVADMMPFHQSHMGQRSVQQLALASRFATTVLMFQSVASCTDPRSAAMQPMLGSG